MEQPAVAVLARKRAGRGRCHIRSGVRTQVRRRGHQEPLRQWGSQKPKGYVLNTDTGLSDRASTRLHRASCFTLEPGFGGGDRQAVAYIKVCSPDPKQLNEWAVGNLGYGLRSFRCQHCEPSSLGLTD